MRYRGLPGLTSEETWRRTPLKSELQRKLLFRLLAILGLVSLTYLLGAAVMFFELPSSGFLRNAFVGARAWNERKQASARPPGPTPDQEASLVATTKIDMAGKTFDGFTLYMSVSPAITGTQALLINMRGDVVHKWAIPFSRVWPKPPHISSRVRDSLVCFFGSHLYANGDLLVVFQGVETSTNGYGLAKLDKDSNVVWKYAANVHHDVDVAEDGTIYALRHEVVHEMPKRLEYIPVPALADYLVLLSPDGKELKRPIPILEAIQDSQYAPLLCVLEGPGKHGVRPGATVPLFVDDARRRDVLHTNFVNVLSRELAPKFPMFKAGQVLISMRHLDTIAVLDPQRGSVVWAARGPWRGQHDPQFLDNGHLLIFDNLGSPQGSRVLEYDPQTQAFPWSYSGENKGPFFTDERGMSQRLPNGNTLVVNSQGSELLEVTASKEVVWACSIPGFIHTARRYSPDKLHFLKGGQRARP
jgi:hypothetical protein